MSVKLSNMTCKVEGVALTFADTIRVTVREGQYNDILFSLVYLPGLLKSEIVM